MGFRREAQSEDAILELQAALRGVLARETRLGNLAAIAEFDLEVIGATAVEDRLQDGVPKTMADLKNANLKIWVLTGDKTDTAINICYSCRLLSKETFLIRMTEDSEHANLEEELGAWATALSSCQSRRPNAVSRASTDRSSIWRDLNVGNLNVGNLILNRLSLLPPRMRFIRWGLVCL